MATRRYLFPLLAGIGMCVAVYLVDLWLAMEGLHAESTRIDDILLGFIAAGMTFLLQRHEERELRRQQHNAVIIEQMNHHIRNALQVIVSRASLDQQDAAAVAQIHTAVARIDWALREILPRSAGGASSFATEPSDTPATPPG